MAKPAADQVQVIARNRKARFDYFVDETVEAGLVLRGSEVKALRAGKANLVDAYAEFRDGEAFLVGAHISEYAFANLFNHAPQRERKLLLHRRELDKLAARVAVRGQTVIPLELYFKGGRVKVLLALARGKRQYDKRAVARERESRRDAEEALRGRR